MRPAGPSASPSPAAPKASAPPSATSSATTPAALGPSLPLRLSLALPASLVGQQAQRRLSGEDGLLATEGTRLSLGEGGLVISNNGANAWQASGAIVSNHSGGIVSNHSGGGAARRLATWGGASGLGPKWPRPRRRASFGSPHGPVVRAALRRAAGPNPARLHQGPAQAGASPAEGKLQLDLRAPKGQGPEARFVASTELERVFGLRAGALRLRPAPEGGLELTTALSYLPWAERPALGQLLGELHPSASLRRSHHRLLASGQGELRVGETQRVALNADKAPDDWATKFLLAFGFSGPQQPDPGLAYWERYGHGPALEDFPLRWYLRGTRGEGDGPPLAGFVGPQGQAITEADERLRALLPSWQPSDESLLPSPPPALLRPETDPDLAPQAPPEVP